MASDRKSIAPVTLSRRSLVGQFAALMSGGLPVARASAAVRDTVETMVHALNTGDRAVLTGWARQHVSAAGLRRRSSEAWGDWLAALVATSGGWTVARIDAAPSGLRLHIRAARLAHVRRVDLRLDRDDAAMVFDLRPVLEPLPYDRAIVPAASVAAFARDVRRRVAYAIASDAFSGTVRVTHGDRPPLIEMAHGWADRDAGRRMLTDTPINLGSIDKSLTAVLIAQLIERGLLTFNTMLVEVLPEFAKATDSGAVTIRHLLTHAGGFGTPVDGILGYSREPYYRVTDLLPAIAKVPRAFPAGARHQYSNEGYVVLGAVIERLTGQTYWDALSGGIYAPARMTHSAHFRRDQLAGRTAVGYCHDSNDLLLATPRHAVTNQCPWRGNSCGGGYSTAADMARFLSALRAGRLVSSSILTELLAPSGHPYPNLIYGMGFALESAAKTFFAGHSGGGVAVGIGSAVRIERHSGWSVIILGNYDVPYAEALLRDIEGMVPAIST